MGCVSKLIQELFWLAHLHSCSYNTKPALHQLRQDHARRLFPGPDVVPLLSPHAATNRTRLSTLFVQNPIPQLHLRLRRPVRTLVSCRDRSFGSFELSGGPRVGGLRNAWFQAETTTTHHYSHSSMPYAEEKIVPEVPRAF